MNATPSTSPMIVVEDVWKSFGDVEVLRGVCFEVKRGETCCLLGGSGGGKTTLLKVMVGIHKPTRGRIIIDDCDTTSMTAREFEEMRRRFGVMFQSGALLNSMSIAENIALPLEHLTSLDEETIETIVKIKLHQVDMLHAAERRPSEISGGMVKRAAVARAMALDPKLLFYDEPSAGLDPIATSRIDQLITRLRDTMGMTNVVVTHVMESVRRIADHVIMLHKGEVALDGAVADLDASEDPRVARFRTGEAGGSAGGVVSSQQFLEDLLM